MSNKIKSTENKSYLNIPNYDRWNKITTFIFCCFAIFWFVTFFGFVSLDFSLFFGLLSLFTGFYWFKERKNWKQYLSYNKNNELERPWWLNWTAGIFPIVLGLFLFRGFIAEQFKIPSGSMIPTLMVGDIILINKFSYDIKIPIIEKKIYKTNEVKRGDIVVFRYPQDASVYYIKRFIGLPGDTIEYDFETKKLKINNQSIEQKFEKNINENGQHIIKMTENLLGMNHKILINTEVEGMVEPGKITSSANNDCTYTIKKMICTIPINKYFAMGDNRDNSLDSRYWGFVPRENVIGKAFLIAFSSTNFDQIGLIK